VAALSNHVTPLAAVLAKTGLSKTPAFGAKREKLKRWFWCAVLGQAYESGSNSQSAKDVAALLDWMGKGPEPDTVSSFRFDPASLREVTPRQRSIYCGVICLILTNGARDFHTQAVITGKLAGEEEIDDHHVFPAHFLEKSKGILTTRHRDCILNRTLIDRTTNQMIRDRAPSKYMTDIRGTRDFPFDAVLSSHFLPVGKDSPFWKDDYEKFLTWRQDRFWQEIRKVTGAIDTSELEAASADVP
jgi:hypothetical protein